MEGVGERAMGGEVEVEGEGIVEGVGEGIVEGVGEGIVEGVGEGPAEEGRDEGFAGVFHFKFPMSSLKELLQAEGGRGGGREVRVWATVGDAYQDSTQSAYASTRVYSPSLKLAFLGGSPQVLHPPMPFRFYLTASQEDGSLVPSYRLSRHRLLVTPEVTLRTGETRRLLSRTVRRSHATFPLWQADLDLHLELNQEDIGKGIRSLLLQGELRDSEGGRSHTSLVAVPHRSPSGRHLHIFTSTQHPKVGENIILHVRTNFYLDKFRYILLSKGCVVEAGQHSMEASLRTFPLPLVGEVAGVATVVVYSVGQDEHLVATALTFPVDALTGKGLSVDVRAGREAGEVVAEVRARPDTIVALTGVDWASYTLQAGNDLTLPKVLHHLWQGVKVEGEPYEQRWVDQNGGPTDILLLPRPSPALDPNTTFSYAGLLVLTDMDLGVVRGECHGGMGRSECLLPGCYSLLERCDGKFDCPDRVDERGCTERGAMEESLAWYRQHRSSRLWSHYTPPWVWQEVMVGPQGVARLTFTPPHTSTHLALTALAVHPIDGLSVLERALEWRVQEGFLITVEAPETVGVWEQVGIRVTARSHHRHSLTATVTLPASRHYHFVDVTAFPASAHSRHHQPQYHQGGGWTVDEQQHKVEVEALSSRTIHLPILPIHPGHITVVVEVDVEELGTHIHKEIEMNVESPGAVQEHHTSLLVDLTNRAYFFTFLDVSTPGYFVPGSADAHVTVFRGAVGPLTPTQLPTPDLLLGLPMAGCEGATFSILMAGLQAQQQTRTGRKKSRGGNTSKIRPETRLWDKVGQESRRQWSRVKQDSDPWGEAMASHWENFSGQETDSDGTDLRTHLAHLYQTILAHQHPDGGFKHFRSSEGSSTWVTCQVVRALNMASHTWPHLLYVDPQVTDKALRFLLEQQDINGAWSAGPAGSVGDHKLVPPHSSSLTPHSTHTLNLSISAHTMLTLMALKDLPSPLDEQVVAAVSRGRLWLEENLRVVEQVSRPVEVSLVALALHLSYSPRANTAFHHLARNAHQEADYEDDFIIIKYMYWGEDMVPLPSYRVESQRPHLKPRPPHTHDAGNVAATAYALTVYSLRGEILTQSIIRWLHSQRSHDGGWRSTQDTLAAWEALLGHSERWNEDWQRPVTLSVGPLHDLSGATTFTLPPGKPPTLLTHKLPDVSSVRVQGRGSGLAVLQLTSRYHVTNPDLLLAPPTPTFLLTPQASWQGRNGSSIVFHTCIKWLFRDSSDTSGLTVLEVSVPTGYGASPEKLNDLVLSKKVPNLRWAEFAQRKATFFFERITGGNTCVEFHVERWYPVANLSSVLPVKVYEYYAPEHYQTELLDMSEGTLDICQVCGSYQCPNCPILSYYSSGGMGSWQTHHPLCWVLLILPLLLLLLTPPPHQAPS
ncbi:hypothetical protein Pmani_036867 [Petrolisthes manimaculis]|uniref:C3 and PZP-like alpha-2-macroglobulin domain-containing protein 8 n=1 Tax=Petrolisthes manimaculis TaxID=1843537 RepID=A0AAE1NJP0_9EUCA|nr:hypothetical protein Pmani_036867 [Petrolisthes manimaculis]